MYRHVLRSALRVRGACVEHRVFPVGTRCLHSTRYRQSEQRSKNAEQDQGRNGSKSTGGGARAVAGLGGTIAVFAGAAMTVSQPESMIASSSSTQAMPRIQQPSSEDAVPLESPSRVISMEQANAKIRSQMHSFNFESQDGNRGRIDIARVPSNEPVEDDWSVGVANGPGGKQLAMAGVYDGHAGWATSTVLREALIPCVSAAVSKLESASSGEAIDQAIKAAFRGLDQRMLDKAQKTVNETRPASPEALSAIAPVLSGSCALLSIYDPSTSILRTAVAGDSRAVRGMWSSKTQDFAAEALSADQTGFSQDEVDRLDKAHPGEKADMLDPRTGRLFGMAITRAFGDHRWKYPLDFIKYLETNFFASGPRPKYKTPPYMTAEPEVTTRQVYAEDFVILASDGLWDHFTNDQAVKCVEQWLSMKRGAKFTPEAVKEQQKLSTAAEVSLATEGYGGWRATPDHFTFEDTDSAAVCLIRNAFGGSRRELFRGVMGETSPRSRYVRDDVTVQVIFFKDPYIDEQRAKKASVWKGMFG